MASYSPVFCADSCTKIGRGGEREQRVVFGSGWWRDGGVDGSNRVGVSGEDGADRLFMRLLGSMKKNKSRRPRVENADSWIVVIGLKKKKNGERLLVLMVWGIGGGEGGLRQGGDWALGLDLRRGQQGGGGHCRVGERRGNRERESGGMVEGVPFLSYIPSAPSLPSETPASLPPSLLSLFSPPSLPYPL